MHRDNAIFFFQKKKKAYLPYLVISRIFGMEGEMIIDELTTFLKTHKLSKQTKLACEALVEELKAKLCEGKQ